MSIPTSQIVQTTAGVVSGGGAASALSGVIVSTDSSLSTGNLQAFYSATDVLTWFGSASAEYEAASLYFGGMENADQLPEVLYFHRMAAAATPATVYGARLSLTLAQLQALSGTLTVTTSAEFSATVDLSTATSFANAATLLTSAFTTPDFAFSWDAQRSRFVVSTTDTGVGAEITYFTGTLANSLGLTASAGGLLQATGRASDDAATTMARLVALSTNWGAFCLGFTATTEQVLEFATWVSAQGSDYLFVHYDASAGSKVANNDASMGAVLALSYDSVLPMFGDLTNAVAALCYVASVNFNVTNGRTNLAFRQFNVTPNIVVDDLGDAQALLTNGYTYCGQYANAANDYIIMYDGAVTGAYEWADTFVDQMYLRRELNRAFFEALLANRSLPYNADGYAAVYAAGADVMLASVASGITRRGVTLSNSQIQIIQGHAGVDISTELYSEGFYIQVVDPTNAAQARTQRTSPQCNIWYCDGGSIQTLSVPVRAVL